MASFLVRVFDLEAGASAGFADVDTGDTHATNIDALAAPGIAQGCTERLFYPRRDTTRAQMATSLNRAIQIVNIRLPSEWLARINAYRTGPGLSGVTERPEWSAGLMKHLEYLRYTDR